MHKLKAGIGMKRKMSSLTRGLTMAIPDKKEEKMEPESDGEERGENQMTVRR